MRPYYLEVLERRATGKDLVRELLRRIRRKLMGAPAGRHVWTPAQVIDADGPELSLRSYLEHRDIRKMLTHVPAERRKRAMEVGSGFGRLVVVLEEFFPEVWGVEREPGLLEVSRELVPSVRYANPTSIADLSGVPGTIDFAMIFTVLMHMTDAEAQAVLAAMRAKAKGGWILIVERTDPGEVFGDNSDSSRFMAHGRPVEKFADWMKPWRLVATLPRSLEPTYKYLDKSGTYMLFQDA